MNIILEIIKHVNEETYLISQSLRLSSVVLIHLFFLLETVQTSEDEITYADPIFYKRNVQKEVR